MRWLVRIEQMLDLLPIAKVALNELEIRQFRPWIVPVRLVRSDYIPAFALQKLNQIRPNESLGTGNDSCLFQGVIYLFLFNAKSDCLTL